MLLFVDGGRVFSMGSWEVVDCGAVSTFIDGLLDNAGVDDAC